MIIHDLYQLDTDRTTTSLLNLLKEKHVAHLNEYLLFNLDGKMKEELTQNIQYLSDDGLWTESELISYEVVAKTIDNEFILSNDTQVLVIPSHLNKVDSEIFDLSIWSFLCQFEEKNLATTILALN